MKIKGANIKSNVFIFKHVMNEVYQLVTPLFSLLDLPIERKSLSCNLFVNTNDLIEELINYVSDASNVDSTNKSDEEDSIKESNEGEEISNIVLN